MDLNFTSQAEAFRQAARTFYAGPFSTRFAEQIRFGHGDHYIALNPAA